MNSLTRIEIESVAGGSTAETDALRAKGREIWAQMQQDRAEMYPAPTPLPDVPPIVNGLC